MSCQIFCLQSLSTLRVAPTTLHLHTIYWSTGFVTDVLGDQFVTSTHGGELRTRGRLEYAAPRAGSADASPLQLHFVEAGGTRGTYTLRFSAESPLQGTYAGPDEEGEFRIIPP